MASGEAELGPVEWAEVYRDENEPEERRQQAFARLIEGYRTELAMGAASPAGGYGDTLTRLVEPEARRIARQEARGALPGERNEFVDDAIRIVCAPRDRTPPAICRYEPTTSPLAAWLCRVLRNRWRDRLRDGRRHRFLPLLAEIEAAPQGIETDSLDAEPFSAGDLTRLQVWRVRDRIEVLCLFHGLWKKVADHDPDCWENWLCEYESTRGISLARPFPPIGFRALNSHIERKHPLGQMLQMRTGTLDTHLSRSHALLGELQCLRETYYRQRE